MHRVRDNFKAIGAILSNWAQHMVEIPFSSFFHPSLKAAFLSVFSFIKVSHLRLDQVTFFLPSNFGLFLTLPSDLAYSISVPCYSSFLFVSHRLTGYGIHHCFAKSMMGHEVKMSLTNNFYADYYTMAGITLASCLAMCPAVGFLGRRGGLLLFMILTALASLLQLGLLNCE